MLHLQSSYSPTPKPRRRPKPHTPHPTRLLRFRPSHLQKTQLLQSLGIAPTPSQSPDRLLLAVDHFRSLGFPDSAFSFLSPHLSTPNLLHNSPLVLDFLSTNLPCTPSQAILLSLKAPEILTLSVPSHLQPTLIFLREVGVRNLNSPTSLNAHLLSSPVERLSGRVEYFKGLGLSEEEAVSVCRRFPAVFGYSLEFNLEPKVGFLVGEMERGLAEIVKFPQYFGFSLEKRIVPRHRHLKQRRKRVALPKMLMYCDERFYAMWK